MGRVRAVSYSSALEGVMSWCADTPSSFRSNSPQWGSRQRVSSPERGCRGPRLQMAHAARAASTGTVVGMPCASCSRAGGSAVRGGGRLWILPLGSRTASPPRPASVGSGGSRPLQDLVTLTRREKLGRAHRRGQLGCSRSPVRSGSTAPANGSWSASRTEQLAQASTVERPWTGLNHAASGGVCADGVGDGRTAYPTYGGRS